MLRKIKLLAVTAMILLLMTGCNLKEKIGENITEEVIESAAGEDVDVEIDGGDVTYTTEEGELTFDEEEGLTIEGEDGSIMTSGGEYEWPVDQASAYLPRFDGGVISYILNGPDSCMLIVDELVMEDYEAYAEAIVNAGYTKDKVESSAEDMEVYAGATEDGKTVSLYFFPSEGSLQITLDASGQE